MSWIAYSTGTMGSVANKSYYPGVSLPRYYISRKSVRLNNLKLSRLNSILALNSEKFDTQFAITNRYTY